MQDMRWVLKTQNWYLGEIKFKFSREKEVMSRLTCFLVVMSVLAMVHAHKLGEKVHKHHDHLCTHDEFMKGKKQINFEQEPSPMEATLTYEKQLRREHKAGNWKPIRILPDYSNLKTSTIYQNFIQQKLFPSTIGFISDAYSVFPKTSITEVQGQSNCQDYTIPKAHRQMGIQGYDLVLYVGVVNAQGEDWLARAGSCIQDRQTFRPVAGIVQINSYYLSKINLNNPQDHAWYSWIQTTIHEVTHVLGFSNDLFRYYINPNTNKKLGQASVSKNANGRTWVVLPTVVKQAQTYFSCTSAWGAPLENNGGSGTAGSHWERTTFGNEAMTGSDFEGAVFSIFTFKLLEGTGWYLPNYNYAQPYVWGQGEGCPIEQGACPRGTSEFCNSSQDLCTVDYMGTGHCGHDDPLAGGCSYWEEYGNMDCREHSDNLDEITNNTGGFVGAGSRCWVTNIGLKVGYSDVYTSCYDSTCAADNKSISVKVGTTSYTCTSDGQVIKVKYNGYSGTITCPPISRFCQYENECPNDCSGRGTCRETVCQCWAGFTGSDCSQQA